jgi:hypothetical protein
MAFSHNMVVLKKGKLHICVNFKKLNATTQKNPYLLPFNQDFLNMMVGHEMRMTCA